MKRDIPLYTLEGVRDAEVSAHPVTTADGLGLTMRRFSRGGRGDVVLLLHGLSASCDMFVMPEHRNLTTFLLDHGFEVWTLDSRMSNRHSYNLGVHRFTLDDIALFDYPAAMSVLRAQVGDRRVHVIAHCLGALAFTMSLAAGTVTGISTAVVNSAGLVVQIPLWSRAKLTVGPFATEYALGMPYLNPQWGDEPRFTRGWFIARVNSLFHRECEVPACHLLSLMWGAGWPALYTHENLLPVTHARIGDLLQASAVHYDRHVRRMARAGRAVKYDHRDPAYRALPDDYLAQADRITTPLLFTSGDRNRIFGDSNKICHQRLDQAAPGRHEYVSLPGYGHIDPFVGRHAAVEVFPQLLDFIKRRTV
jgi:lysosomal acid lipase/cholesteryl ester hydrolase